MVREYLIILTHCTVARIRKYQIVPTHCARTQCWLVLTSQRGPGGAALPHLCVHIRPSSFLPRLETLSQPLSLPQEGAGGQLMPHRSRVGLLCLQL